MVIPTRDRPQLVRGAIEAVIAQDYAGPVRVIVVYDGTHPVAGLARSLPGRKVEVVVNSRAAGLAGARNCGIDALDTPLVAFCDDDDEWLPGKLTAQVEALRAHPTAQFCACSILVEFDGKRSPRLAYCETVRHEDLLRSRMAMLHSSTFLIRREALATDIGLIDEAIPGGQNEDWDLLLRASARHPIVHVDRPLVLVRWGRTSFFSRQWETKIASLKWMLRRHPDIAGQPIGAARVYGQLAFAYACLGDRRAARRWAGRSLRRRAREWRAGVALLVSTGAVSGETVLRVLHRYGRGV